MAARQLSNRAEAVSLAVALPLPAPARGPYTCVQPHPDAFALDQRRLAVRAFRGDEDVHVRVHPVEALDRAFDDDSLRSHFFATLDAKSR
jgi:hypothetical protein